MKKVSNFIMFIAIGIVLLSFKSCVILRPPEVVTGEVTEVGPTTALAGGEVTKDGNADIIVRGVCWDTRKSPNTEDARTTDGYGTGKFTSNVSGLQPNTTYFLRAYAINSEGTSYGNQVTFTTSLYASPELTTRAVTGITQTSARSGGNITSDGGIEITERGVCWSSTKVLPDITDSKTSDGTGSGSFESNLTGLSGNTTYYVRAYATNEQGTGYGAAVQFKTGALPPTVTTAVINATSPYTAQGGGLVTGDGGSPVTSRGVCWSTSANPTVANSRTTDGGGTGSFVSNLSSLSPNTTYHVRAYAINAAGTAYGADREFTTDPLTVSDIDGNDYDVIRIGTQLWMAENLMTTRLHDGTPIVLTENAEDWSSLDQYGYCWYGNISSNGSTYGALYNWNAVSSGMLCPAGWRVASDNDWLTLKDFIGGELVAGGKLKETGISHWTSPNTGATDEYDFTALPGGWRTAAGSFQGLRTNGYWWTSSEIEPNAWYRNIQNDSEKLFRVYAGHGFGMSVRCVKN
jgi:uncharacterized protein (TIGR02145 family)